jgi:hypothetical protein
MTTSEVLQSNMRTIAKALAREALWEELDTLYRQVMNKEPHSEFIPILNRIGEIRQKLGLKGD